MGGVSTARWDVAAGAAGILGSGGQARVQQMPRNGSMAVLPEIVCGHSAMPERCFPPSARTGPSRGSDRLKMARC